MSLILQDDQKLKDLRAHKGYDTGGVEDIDDDLARAIAASKRDMENESSHEAARLSRKEYNNDF